MERLLRALEMLRATLTVRYTKRLFHYEATASMLFVLRAIIMQISTIINAQVTNKLLSQIFKLRTAFLKVLARSMILGWHVAGLMLLRSVENLKPFATCHSLCLWSRSDVSSLASLAPHFVAGFRNLNMNSLGLCGIFR